MDWIYPYDGEWDLPRGLEHAKRLTPVPSWNITCKSSIRINITCFQSHNALDLRDKPNDPISIAVALAGGEICQGYGMHLECRRTIPLPEPSNEELIYEYRL